MEGNQTNQEIQGAKPYNRDAEMDKLLKDLLTPSKSIREEYEAAGLDKKREWTSLWEDTVGVDALKKALTHLDETDHEWMEKWEKSLYDTGARDEIVAELKK